MKRWYVVQSKPGQEQVAEINLQRQGYITYLPRCARKRRRAARTHLIQAPLFPGYLFVELDLEQDRWRSVNGTFGVSAIVCFGSKPSPLPQGLLRAIREREDEHGLIQLDEECPFRADDPVAITHGPFTEQTGLFQGETPDRERVIVLLSLLGRKVSVKLPSQDIRAAG